MKKKEEIDRKLANYLSGNQTELEKNEVEAWIRQSKGNTFQFNELKKLWEKRTNDYKLIDHESVKSTVWSSYQRELPLKNDAGGRKFWKYEYRKLAAVILILLLPAVIIIYQFKDRKSVV